LGLSEFVWAHVIIQLGGVGDQIKGGVGFVGEESCEEIGGIGIAHVGEKAKFSGVKSEDAQAKKELSASVVAGRDIIEGSGKIKHYVA
jgi:hypothetical protein